MVKGLHFRPELLEWWQLLKDLPRQCRAVHRWSAAAHPPDHGLARHEQHSTATLVVCLRGVARISYADEHLDLHAGEAVVVQAGAWHRHHDARGHSIVYQQGVLGDCSDFFLYDRLVHLVSSVPQQPSWRLLEQLAASDYPEERVMLLGSLAEVVTSEISEPLETFRPEVRRLQALMWRNMHRPVRIEQLLQGIDMSRAQVYRLFTQQYGMSPARALIQMRIQLAQGLLRAGVTVGAAAERSGFASRQVFAAAFKRETGLSPRAWLQEAS